MTGPRLSDWHLQSTAAVATVALIGVLVVLLLPKSAPPANPENQTIAISAQWRGATADRVSTYVTEPIERKLADIARLSYTQSLTEAGRTTVYVTVGEVSSEEFAATVHDVRSAIQVVSEALPDDVAGPYLISEFTASGGKLLAFAADDVPRTELLGYIDEARPNLALIDGVGRIDLLGAGELSFSIDFFSPCLEMLSINLQSVLAALQEQHGLVVQPTSDLSRVRIRETALSEQDIRNLTLRVDSLYFRLSDVAEIKPDYSAAPAELFRFDGSAAIGVAIAPLDGSDTGSLTAALEAQASQLRNELPPAVRIALIPQQPELVSDAMSTFMRALFGVISSGAASSDSN